MKTKFFLMFLALNGFALGANTVFAATASATTHSHDINSLSQTISELVDLGSDSHSLVASAIDRALLARSIQSSALKENPNVLINGIIYNPNPQPQPIINGKVANPNPKLPLIGGGIPTLTNHHLPFINGKIANPHHPPLIIGKIANPNPPILINGTMIRVDPKK